MPATRSSPRNSKKSTPNASPEAKGSRKSGSPNTSSSEATTSSKSPLGDTKSSKMNAKASPKGDSKSKTTPKSRATKSKDDKSTPTGTYLLQVTNVTAENPQVSRLLSVPMKTTFFELHQVLQVAFGWANSHSWNFEIPHLPAGADPQDNDSYDVLYISTMYIHDEGVDPKKLPSRQIHEEFESCMSRGLRCVYEYDMGDSWRHHIQILGHGGLNMFDEDYVCFGGEGHPVAEDSGNFDGWEGLKSLFKARKLSEEDKEMKRWYKEDCNNRDPKGLAGDRPYRWDQDFVNDNLYQLQKCKTLEAMPISWFECVE